MWWRRRQDPYEDVPLSPLDEDVTDAGPAAASMEPSRAELDIDLRLDEVGADAPSKLSTSFMDLEGSTSSMDFAPLDWSPPPDDLSGEAAPAALGQDELMDEHDSAVELADIMMSFGRIQGAAQTLADFIRHNPRQGVAPWLKLLDVYKTAGMQGEFEALTRQLNSTFNVKVVSWDDFDAVRMASETIEQMPHIVARLQATWASRDSQVYLHELLRDNRDGTRQGFPLAVINEILCLLGVLHDLIGPFRPDPADTPAA